MMGDKCQSSALECISLQEVITNYSPYRNELCVIGNETYDAVLFALRSGYRHIDTAELYRNEADVGRAIKTFTSESGVDRGEIWVTTKLWPQDRSFDDVKAALDDSLRRLSLDYVDLYLIHSPNDKKNRREQWRALTELQQEGKARSIGVSNYGIHHLEELFASSDVKPCVNQVELSPFLPRQDLARFCSQHNIAIEAYSPLTKAVRLSDPRVTQVAAKYGATPAQLLIQWCLQHDYITIPKSVNEGRIVENMMASSVFGSEGKVGIAPEDLEIMQSWDEGLVTGWDPTTGP
jgi:methylglyoxal/glyoxal reductase